MNTQLLNGMVVFKQVVDCGSFTQAADKLNHSKSFISGEVNKLESRLGVRLLQRTTRQLSLTQAGEIYYHQCQNIIHDAQLVEQQLTGQQQIPQGNLRVSCPVSFALAHIRPILAEYMELNPQVIVELDLNDQLVDVIGDGFDLTLRASGQLDDSSLISRKLTTVETVTIASPSYLKKWGTPKLPEDLPQHRTINFRSSVNQNVWQFQDKTGRKTTVKVASHLLTNSAEMELAICKTGQGIARVPQLVLTDELKKGTLVQLFKDYMPVTTDIYMIYPNRQFMPSKVRSFIDFLINKLG